VRKSESAMLPFLQQKIAARKCWSTRINFAASHNAAELTNATGKTLRWRSDHGLRRAEAYGGEALVETLKTGDKRFISYAVDLGTRSRRSSIPARMWWREIHLRRGILTARTRQSRPKRTRFAMSIRSPRR